MRKLFASLIILLSITSLFAQKEYHKWYFGDQAAMDFVPGAPVTLTNSAMQSTDNPATISDSLGNLLFYCNGEQVWNRNHTLMPNGNGLLGSNSGGHTATLVRQPQSSNLYYLFTMDLFAFNNGLRYNVIDLNLNGGLGDIVAGQKNIVLFSPASEQIIPVLHSNGTDIWIITHPWNSSSFNCYLLSCNGLDTTPVVSTVGQVRNGSGSAAGQISINAANNRIAWVNYGTGTWELFDFNNATGALSNALTFSGIFRPWGIEFSPDGSKLYLTGWTTQYVLQFDLSTYTQSAIAASEVNLGNVTGPGSPYFTGYMQRAPDDKIYMAVFADTYLAVINNPNASGTACNLVDNGFYLAGRTSSAGLPDKIIVRPHSSSSFSLGPDTSYCGSFSTTLSSGNPNTLWNTGVTASQITVNTAGTYWASVAGGCTSGLSDTIVIAQSNLSISLQSINTTCGLSNGSLIASVSTGQTPYIYNWSNGGTNDTLSNLSAGIYSVTVHDANGCSSTAGATVNSSGTGSVTITSDKSIMCSGDSAWICVSGSFASYLWNTGQTGQCIYTRLAGNYYVTATDNGNCSAASNHIALAVYPMPPVSISINGDTLTGYNAVTYQWYFNNVPIPGATSPVYIAPQSGDYNLAVTDSNGCYAVSTAITIVKTGINDLREEAIKVFTNPSMVGSWQLEVGNEWIGGMAEVFDMNGRVVFKSEIRNQKSEIGLEAERGIYFLHIAASQKTILLKLVRL